jgi:hypothetical protein
MKSLSHFDVEPAGSSILADDILEFHAARLLLLIRFCGKKSCIEGLTKMAKLDFFVRYPQFFATICDNLQSSVTPSTSVMESAMIRYHYGPWDRRYYQVLGYLEGRQLIEVARHSGKGPFYLCLTEKGKKTAEGLASSPSFSELIEQMKRVKKALGNRTGSSLKKLIYDTFSNEVSLRGLGERII